MGATETLLQVEGLTKSYDGSSKALEGVSFSMNRGEFVSLIGSSGAGKSTLLRCINRLIDPTCGSVVFDGRETSSARGRALREMEPAAKMYAKIVAVANAAAKGETVPEEQQFTIPEAMDVMIRWFCLLFGDQFTVDDVLDHYPVDRLMHDVALALLAVQTQTTGILNDFPTPPAATQAEKNPA